MCKNIAIIPARGGSKRIPKKNIKNFCGKPIIAYSIEAAIKSNIFDEVMVSTDSEEIANIAMSYGASVPFYRSKETSDDFATTSDVIMEVLNNYIKAGKNYQYAFCIYPTAPFITPELIVDAEILMKDKKPNEIVTVVEFSYPPQRSYIVTEDGMIKYKYEQYVNSRSQDLEKWYHDVGQLYVFDVENFRANNGQIRERIMPIMVSPLVAQDIDTENDWLLAEEKYKLINKMGRGES
ncbi:MAG: pseudaminic acid cytidylyltransferase [Lachnospiraceae bacterium]|nr:pseudaminic acid cytidylyltransferase [Lachnospiraceae bacterium]